MTQGAETLESVFRALAPSDLAGAVDFRSGRPSEAVARALVDEFLTTPVVGVKSSPELKSFLDEVAGRGSAAADLFQNVRLHTSAGPPSRAPASHSTAQLPNGAPRRVELAAALGCSSARRFAVALVSAPYVHPAVRYAERAELFLSAVPTAFMSRCVPKLIAEFQFDRPRSDALISAPSMLKFLLGTGQGQLGGANGAMLEASRRVSGDRETSTAGPELYAASQALAPLAPSPPGSRYVPVSDPTRPAATLTGAEISVAPTVGFFSYKRAKLSLVIHDKSRLSEYSDLIKPEVYPRTTIWLTYGWSAPDEPSDPYAEFIRAQCSVREAYGIVNASYVFERDGAVRVDLELFTRGAAEARATRISEAPESVTAAARKLQRLRDDLAAYRRARGLDDELGIGREIRPFQVLDGAEKSSLPDLSRADLRDAVAKLLRIVEQPDPRVDPQLQRELVSELKSVQADAAALRRSASEDVARKFAVARDGADPFLPQPERDSDNPLAGFAASRNAHRSEKGPARIASFAKVFSSFVVPALLSADPKLDVQVFFYSFNSQAGPASSTNIGEFPVEMPVFVDRWREHVQRRGTESISVEEFAGVLADATVSDPRSVGYGLRSFYSYDAASGYVEDPTKTAKRESREAEAIARWGPFKKPAIEVYVEALPCKSDPSARVMRIHVYDKVAHPYRAQGAFLRASDGSSTFIEVSKRDLSAAADASKTNSDLVKRLAQAASDPASRFRRVDASTSSSIKAAVASAVPTILYGSTATSVLSANLASQHEALLSTVQMLRAGKRNNTQPNGSGTGGLPLRVIPSTLQLTTLGCPLLQLAQLWFVDFQTGTTVDNLYILTHLTHTLAPGKFESQATFGFADAYGVLEGAPTIASALEAMSRGRADEPRATQSKRPIRRAPRAL